MLPLCCKGFCLVQVLAWIWPLGLDNSSSFDNILTKLTQLLFFIPSIYTMFWIVRAWLLHVRDAVVIDRIWVIIETLNACHARVAVWRWDVKLGHFLIAFEVNISVVVPCRTLMSLVELIFVSTLFLCVVIRIRRLTATWSLFIEARLRLMGVMWKFLFVLVASVGVRVELFTHRSVS